MRAERRSPAAADGRTRVWTSAVAGAGAFGCLAALARAAEGGGHGAGHADPFSLILIQLAVVIVAATIGRWAAAAAGQPSVLGELLIGVLIGNVGVALGAPLFVLVMQLGAAAPLFAEIWSTGLSIREAAASVFSPAELAPGGIGERLVELLTGPRAAGLVVLAFSLWLFSNLGVILLLFMVGLETTVSDMLQVGPRALAVAVVGIVAPFLLGYGASALLMREAPASVHLFVGATLCATSVGITARVFKDLGKLQTPEAKVILGAAVIDDVLGLVILAIVVGIVVTGGVQLREVIRITVLAAAFLGVVIVLGERLVKRMIPFAAALDRHHVNLLFPLALCFTLSWLANQIELATIVGAFAAGLILNDEQFAQHGGAPGGLEEIVRPLEAIFAPIFFVLMGMQVDLASFLSLETVGIALALIVAGVVGKAVSGLAAGPDADHLTVGVGMIPRGEVGLIFASIGKGLGVVDAGLFSAVVLMVIVTTLLAPLLLKWSLARQA
jgi:Kef-type K+ transport system membrane component KefB